ncbi:MAG: hypothetical protein IJD21_03990 [Oscillospiraceae bacterium]|nr:hypothetical protein [Oscillospiraceae bacterium]
MKKLELDRHCPAGMGSSTAVAYYTTTFLLGSFYAAVNYSLQIQRLRRMAWDITSGRHEVALPTFHATVEQALFPFLLFALGGLVLVGLNYLYHYQGSRSIYLMRRLPRRWELLRRCTTLPLAGGVLLLVWALLLALLFRPFYLAILPEGYEAAGLIAVFWR